LELEEPQVLVVPDYIRVKLVPQEVVEMEQSEVPLSVV
jgi:hypothetical protein